MSGTVLVTGGFGLVGSATARQLAADGRRVIVADLDTPANRKAADKLPDGVEYRWTDLTDAGQVERLVSETAPAAVIHLAAIIAPAIYRAPKLARKVNVDATATLVRIAEAQPNPPRFVHASSNAVFGPRNPHRNPEPLRADDPMRPCDIYSGTKAEAEEIVRSSSLDWVVLRFGGVLSTDLGALPLGGDAMLFESALPSDNRVQTVDVRDVAFACAAATTADVVGEILLIAGDESHRHCYGDLAPALVAALGMPGAIPPGRPGDPDSDTDWFVTDWMDTTRAQEALQFQRHSWDDMMGELRSKFWFARIPGALLAPLVREFMKRRSVYWNAPGKYADPWGAIRDKLGDPSWERP
ncbi:Nucleoside-diphosphate-sugar epimerase [Mycolicibacterium rutilum]|uniref:Nucleoside-diphosphate-sugar epimerase n=1 Tax=Mycolicibacterium rutilum TaxID=370526 RepID=A0A1H6KJB1_MYCRU|nr:NAD(P)-dependent oxidoreductase [Mycolicibacterium rutilum]SEH71630.1 Nucleoside-diphosphate-sugar epimerase [Mycolicibacterium rutilum]